MQLIKIIKLPKADVDFFIMMISLYLFWVDAFVFQIWWPRMYHWAGLPEYTHWDLLAGNDKLLNGCFHVWRGCWSLHPADVVSVVSGASPFLFIFHLLFFQKGPPQPERRCDPGKGIIWLPVAPSLSPTSLARSSFLSVFLSLTWSLLEILPLSPGMDVPPETSKHVKKSTSQKLEDQKKVRRGSFLPLPLSSARLKVQDHQQWDEILHAGFLQSCCCFYMSCWLFISRVSGSSAGV